MKPINVLIFDDDADDLAETKDSLELGWDAYRIDKGGELPELHIDTIRDHRKMAAQLKPGFEKSCSVFICDIIVDQDGDGEEEKAQTRGFRFLRKARTLGVPVCVLISHGYTDKYSEFETQKKNFSKSFDLAWIKDHFYDSDGPGPRAQLISDLAVQMQSCGVLETLAHSLSITNEKDEARTLALVEEVGRETLNAFATIWTLRGASGYKLRVLAPGLSGAKVIQVEYSGLGEDFTDRPQVIKVSRDQRALQRELESFRKLDSGGHHVANAVARPSSYEVRTVNDWAAIAFRGVPAAVTFVDWLADAETSHEQVESALEFLYKRDGLTKMYKGTAEKGGDAIEVLRDKTLTRYRQMGIYLAIQELQHLIGVYGQGMGWNRELVENFVKAGAVGSIPTLTKFWEVPLVLCHGDFHGRNVLVEVDGEARRLHIIDLASMGKNLWPTDVVRLCVDVALTGWDGGWKSYEWSRLAGWSTLIELLFGEGPKVEGSNACVAAALRWLRKNSFQNHGLNEEPGRVAEYDLALAVELLRASYRRVDLTAPKRALALIAASLVLTRIDSSMSRKPASTS